MDFKLITTPDELQLLVEQIKDAQWLALDTEFMRESTYYPKLCLIQIATEKVCACIDVLALDDIDPVLDELRQPNRVKIFHSARQDLEVIYTTYQIIPTPIFDTQIAASLLRPSEQISYGELVADTLSVDLSKSQSRTDWSRRPLSDAQLTYALDDVRYLGKVYEDLQRELSAKKRLAWLEEECTSLCKLDNFTIEPEHTWKSVKGVSKISNTGLPYIKQLATWREITAQQRNLPRQWILPDRAITDIVQLDTLTSSSIIDYLQSEQPKVKKLIGAIVEEMDKTMPSIAAEEAQEVTRDRRLSRQQQEQVKQLMQFVRDRADQLGATSSLLANRKSIEKLVRGESSRVTQGWRKQLFGDDLLKLLEN